jgi:hypothetical protein
MKAAKISTAFAFIFGIALITGCSSVQNLTKQNVLTVKSDDGSSITYGVHGQGGHPIIFLSSIKCKYLINLLFQ